MLLISCDSIASPGIFRVALQILIISAHELRQQQPLFQQKLVLQGKITLGQEILMVYWNSKRKVKFRGEKVLKILHRTIHIHFLSRNNQTIWIIVFPNVLPQEEAQCGCYQPKYSKFVKKWILKILFTVIYKWGFSVNLDDSQYSLPYLEYTRSHCSTQCFACCASISPSTSQYWYWEGFAIYDF